MFSSKSILLMLAIILINQALISSLPSPSQKGDSFKKPDLTIEVDDPKEIAFWKLRRQTSDIKKEAMKKGIKNVNDLSPGTATGFYGDIGRKVEWQEYGSGSGKCPKPLPEDAAPSKKV